ncbi:hypothetical protein EMPG_12859 [Blastomyces silverae]|uniref:Uncharacterized protein n=1 Tax=Blastomyces silverae TaxID=2060906 RepID=A0A0H1BKH1_9EURO|nr:hypothetical protein EMPG_12859 [Blastomyces silverae]
MVWDKEKWAPEDQPQVEGRGVRCASRLETCVPRSTILSTSGFSQPITRARSGSLKGMKNAAEKEIPRFRR